ncbi:alanine racemase [Pseudonocardia sp. CA-107938]|uniref:alanine racemase n=1 Tax=Pseudonocardia sp. CA-107938 TaxID=3240021 RepID=UPI003D930923
MPRRTPPRSAEAVVDLAAIATNTKIVRSRTSAALMAVVKADAFGHGMVPVARAALDGGATWLGVVWPGEAMVLRSAGVTAPVLAWLYPPAAELRPAIAAGVDLAASTFEQLAGIAAATTGDRRARVHLKVDTGLARSGAAASDWPALVAAARRYERAGRIEVVAVWSHLADADADDPVLVAAQVARLAAAVDVATAAGLRPQLRHLANSAGALHHADTHLDLVRVGIALYGCEPVPQRPVGLHPAMTLRAPVVSVKRVAAGTGVSYRHEYVTRTATRLALVPVGYADGIPRAAAGAAQVWTGTERRPVAGVIAMDQLVVDIGPAGPDPSEVVLFGPGVDGEPTVAEWAAWADTIPHELLCRVGARVERRHVG